MANLTPDPLENGGIAAYAQDLRAGKTTAAKATRAYLDRIEALNPRLQAYQHVAPDMAMAAAEAVDKLLAAGTDLGPLMGVPTAIKDIVAVEGMPTTNGSLHDASDITGPEGRYVQGLKQAGVVILGKSKTVEYALGASGVSIARGTPWNPWDAAVHRIPGGSSSGSAVATAAGMAAWGLGSDTGGSVRIPSAFNGLFGHKTTVGLLPTDGVFPLSPTLDTLGPLCRTAADSAIIFGVTTGQDIPQATNLKGLRLGRPTHYFYEDLDDAVAECMEAAIARLVEAGVEIVDVEIPDPSERDWIFPAIVPAEMISAFGTDRFNQIVPNMDPHIANRAKGGLGITAVEHASALKRHRELRAIGEECFNDVDGWITPSVTFTPLSVEQIAADETVWKRSMLSSRNSQTGNLLALCGFSIPVHQFGSALPVGLQINCKGGDDAKLLSIGLAMEDLFGEPGRPDLSGFY
jgi:aspartyl-tRNA(Asn)/glutamyl-tRNA(Gln) amidotransferase subunit A